MSTFLCTRCHENEPVPTDEWCRDCILEIEFMLAELEEPVSEPDFRWKALGSNGQYTLEDIQVRVAEYEDEYGLPSDALLELHRKESAPLDVPAFDRHVWLSLYREILQEKGE